MSVPSSSDEKESVVEPHKDEFDVSDSDDGGLAKKVMRTQKKPAVRKLGRQEDACMNIVPKKKVTTSKRKKESTDDAGSKSSEVLKTTVKVAPKKLKKAILESDSDSDFKDALPVREKPAGR